MIVTLRRRWALLGAALTVVAASMLALVLAGPMKNHSTVAESAGGGGRLAVRRDLAPAGASASPSGVVTSTTAVSTPASTPPPLTHSAAPPPPVLAPAIGSLGQLGAHFPAGAVALTFDDGPDPTWTPQILHVLAQHHAVGTFFDIGVHASARPDIVRAEFAAGHGVGNHTWTHPDLTHLLAPAVLSQLDQTDSVLEQFTGVQTSCLRPPYDAIDPAVRVLTAQRGLTMMLYDVDPRDWARPGAPAIAARVLGAVHAGSIVDLHDGGGNRSETVAALPLILNGLAARHLTPVAICR